jgi:hypothetical protein
MAVLPLLRAAEFYQTCRARLFEALECNAAGRRDTAAVCRQAPCHALAVGDELAADGYCIVHAGEVIVTIRSGRSRRKQCEAA